MFDLNTILRIITNQPNDISKVIAICKELIKHVKDFQINTIFSKTKP